MHPKLKFGHLVRKTKSPEMYGIVEATGNWPNVHGVPEDVIERMRARWESVDEGEQK